jgi:rubrerythrin
MSPIDNLDEIKKVGLKNFMKLENTRWVCAACGSPICGNDRKCYTCGKQYPFHAGGMGTLRSN